MSKLNIDQKTIKSLLQDNKADFLIPDYQRPYAWEEKECQTLWDDIFAFSFPDYDYSKFNKEKEYFLGPIVTFENTEHKKEVIDGQQRLTTIMLLLRAFYDRYSKMMDPQSKTTRENIEKCIWKTDELDNLDKNALKIDSLVATDKDKDEFLDILKTGIVQDNYKSKYSQNFKFFQDKIDQFLKDYPSFFHYLPTRILNNCILLPIEAEDQDTALRIFSTLNDRGKPLSDADIFKAQFYKYYSKTGNKDIFIKQWKDLEEISEKVFHPIYGTPMDELFTRYMYFERSKKGNKSSTTEALRKFYEKDDYALLKRDDTMANLKTLADFWEDVSNQDAERFSDRILRRLFVLNYSPNSMWTYFVSVYFMQNKKADDSLDEESFFNFLSKTIAFTWAYAVTNPGVNALRTPVYAEMVNIVNGLPVTFNDFKFDKNVILSKFKLFNFYNGRPITKSMLAWWAFQDDGQPLLSLETVLEIEHIFARNRQDKEKSLSNSTLLELLGNKALLEKRINIRASDYRFEDKKKFYLGFSTAQGKDKKGTDIFELKELAKNEDFVEKDLTKRNEDILNAFADFLEANGLVQ